MLACSKSFFFFFLLVSIPKFLTCFAHFPPRCSASTARAGPGATAAEVDAAFAASNGSPHSLLFSSARAGGGAGPAVPRPGPPSGSEVVVFVHVPKVQSPEEARASAPPPLLGPPSPRMRLRGGLPISTPPPPQSPRNDNLGLKAYLIPLAGAPARAHSLWLCVCVWGGGGGGQTAGSVFFDKMRSRAQRLRFYPDGQHSFHDRGCGEKAGAAHCDYAEIEVGALGWPHQMPPLLLMMMMLMMLLLMMPLLLMMTSMLLLL